MNAENASASSLGWLGFALMTVLTWGLYGAFLHQGVVQMGDKVNGRYKAFLFVGLAYFLTAVLAPLALLWIKGASWNVPRAAMVWSLWAGLLGAAGAFCVLLAFGAKGHPGVVMSIIFAGAPVVNALYVFLIHRQKGRTLELRWPFLLGIVLAAAGGCLVTFYKPVPAPPSKASGAASTAAPSSSTPDLPAAPKAR